MNSSGRLVRSGWVILDNVEGFTAFQVHVLAAQVDGEPRLLGLRLDPKPDATARSCVLTSARLRVLPLSSLLRQALALQHFDLAGWAWLAQDTAAKKKGRPRGGDREHSRAVAEVYQAARNTPGAAPRQAVAQAFSVSVPTADRYIAEARRTGDLDPYRKQENG